MGKSKKSSYKQLDTIMRLQIQQLLDQGRSISEIARVIERSPSTIAREIERNSEVCERSGNDCVAKKQCHERAACNSECNNKLCKHCKYVNCYEKCPDYIPACCDTLAESPHVCNGCPKYNRCVMEKRIYKGATADRLYRAKQSDKSSGFNMTEEQVKRIDNLISPLIKNGMSPYAALQVKKSEIKISKATLYRMIDSGMISARNIDLPEKVSRKPSKLRKRRNKDAYAVLTAEKKGHMYSDYLEYAATHNAFTVEMDCVEGKKTDSSAILTLHWKDPHMQLYFMLAAHDSGHVVEMLDWIETSLDSLLLFKKCFPLILTDNGQEFTDIEGMERSCLEPGEKRTHIFFCEPNRSDQKGSCECNHKLLRRIVRKGTSIENLGQSHMTLTTNHINSYIREETGGGCPYDMAFKMLPKDFFLLLGLEKIPSEQVILRPSLIGITGTPLVRLP